MRLSVKFKTTDGVWQAMPDFQTTNVVESMMLEVDEMPLFVTHFHLHEDSKRLHTICRRVPDSAIDVVEW